MDESTETVSASLRRQTDLDADASLDNREVEKVF